MCLEENYSDSPSNEYSRHYSAESKSEYLRRQNMDSKLGEEQKKKGHLVRRSPNFDPNSDKKQKKVKTIMSYFSAKYSDSTRLIPNYKRCIISRFGLVLTVIYNDTSINSNVGRFADLIKFL